jgi:hypothetical protein
MLWVWILPGVVLAYAVTALLTISPWYLSAETGPYRTTSVGDAERTTVATTNSSSRNHSTLQLAYSLGALWASRTLVVPSCARDNKPHAKDTI